jgi:hypothetical protein
MIDARENKQLKVMMSDSHNFESYSRNSPPLHNWEVIDCRELACRLDVPVTWVRDQVRSRAEDPLPHMHLGKYVRFLWGSSELEDWIVRRIVKGNNRRVERVR